MILETCTRGRKLWPQSSVCSFRDMCFQCLCVSFRVHIQKTFGFDIIFKPLVVSGDLGDDCGAMGHWRGELKWAAGQCINLALSKVRNGEVRSKAK